MTAFAPKVYQRQVLDSVVAYFRACHELPSPSVAFTAATERLWGRGVPYRPLAGFPAWRLGRPRCRGVATSRWRAPACRSS